MTETELIDFDLIRRRGERWQYRYAVGANFCFARNKDMAIAMGLAAYKKALPGELLTREQRFERANQDEISASSMRWGHLPMSDLMEMLEKMGGDISSLHHASLREFNENGGRRTASAVSRQGARETGEMRMKLERYIEWRCNDD
ncbi:phage tail protein [Dickeya undicola]|uniref:Phage tail protein n=1 Tax=Dickeya undicola TaxID=1577887 RepID=A0A3N0G6L8_9GAMM|nr:phage tail protein [Dickeya undicola]